MWLKSLFNTQLELQSHRIWLTSFRCRAAWTNRYPQSTIDRRIDPFPLRHYAIQQQTRRYSAQRHRQKRPRVSEDKKKVAVRVNDDTVAILRELRQAVADGDIRAVIQFYTALDVKDVLRPTDFRVIAQCLQQNFRGAKKLPDSQARRALIEELLAFAQTLANDLTQGKIASHRHAHIHLLGFFKECGARDAGIRFWKWLEQQSDLYVNANVYGSAIELLAANGSPLEELEDLYQQALARFPGPFLSYHLSPEAIVAERETATTLDGVPVGLLQAIVMARLMRGDTRNAYLAFDTALRLYPDQLPRRFFHLFMEERPLLEACTVFAMACRAGIVVSTPHVVPLLVHLRHSSDLSSIRVHALMVRAMLSMLYAHAAAGGEFTQSQLDELVIAIARFFRLKGMGVLDPKLRTKALEQTMELIRTAIAVFALRRAKPGIPAFHSIISDLGGRGGSSRTIGVALADMRSLGLQPDARIRRAVLAAAGRLKDARLVQKAWGELLQTTADDGYTLIARDFGILIRSAVATAQPEFARSQLEKLSNMLADGAKDELLGSLQFHTETSEQMDQPADVVVVDTVELSRAIESIRADLSVLEQALRDGSSVRDLRESPLLMTVLPVEPALPEAETRRLYDELSTNPRSADASEVVDEELSSLQDTESQPLESSREDPAPPALSSTNLPFATLRYENWKNINSLIEQAEISDQAFSHAVDEAISAGTIPPQRRLKLRIPETIASGVGLSDFMRDGPNSLVENRRMSAAEIEAGRQKILRLRGRVQ